MLPDTYKTISVHLMLSGGFIVTTNPEEVKGKVLQITLCTEPFTYFIVYDIMQLAKVEFNKQYDLMVLDALNVNESYLRNKITENPNKSIKSFLIDQNIILGIGSAYADEICYHMDIHPSSKMKYLSRDYSLFTYGLVNKIHETLLNAIESLEEITPDSIAGEERSFLSVHNPERELCPKGNPILNSKIASKTTYYTNKQVIYK
jgi:formamidopyrimidine-DNA glycosylase